MEKTKNNRAQFSLRRQYAELNCFYDTDDDLKILGMTVEEIKAFRDWQKTVTEKQRKMLTADAFDQLSVPITDRLSGV